MVSLSLTRHPLRFPLGFHVVSLSLTRHQLRFPLGFPAVSLNLTRHQLRFPQCFPAVNLSLTRHPLRFPLGFPAVNRSLTRHPLRFPLGFRAASLSLTRHPRWFPLGFHVASSSLTRHQLRFHLGFRAASLSLTRPQLRLMRRKMQTWDASFQDNARPPRPPPQTRTGLASPRDRLPTHGCQQRLKVHRPCPYGIRAGSLVPNVTVNALSLTRAAPPSSSAQAYGSGVPARPAAYTRLPAAPEGALSLLLRHSSRIAVN